MINGFKLNWRAWKIFWKIRPAYFVVSVFYALITTLKTYVLIYLSARFIFQLSNQASVNTLYRLVIIILLVTAILEISSNLLGRYQEYQETFINYDDKKIYLDKMMQMDYSDIDRQYVYDLYSQITQNDNLSGYGFRNSYQLFNQLVMTILQIIGGFSLSISLFVIKIPKVAVVNNDMINLMLIGSMLLLVVMSAVCVNKSKQCWVNYSKKIQFTNRIFSFYAYMSNQRFRAIDVRMYQQQENVADIYLSRKNYMTDDSPIVKNAKGKMGIWLVVSEGFIALLRLIVYFYVGIKAYLKAFDLGMVTQYIGAITKMFSGIADLFTIISDISVNGEFLKTTFEFIDIENKMYQGSLTTEKRSDRQYEIEFKNVSFKYPGTSNWVLKNVNLKFQIGKRLAIVGMNGSGKTTFIKLLCRLYDPDEGEILLNGINIKKYRYQDYIDIFSIVFQDFQLFAFPLGQNVAANKQYDEIKVTESLNKAGLSISNKQLMNHLDTYLYKDLNQDGIEISGGEAQKIAIARAIYKDAPFMILDEPTAALDPISEAEIYQRFDEITTDKTTIYISHRLSSCHFCDLIAVFDHGSIVQFGTHHELLQDATGMYYRLWKAQAQYYT